MAVRVTADRIAVGIYEYYHSINKSIPSPLRKRDFYDAMRAMSLGSQYITLKSEWARISASKYVEVIVDDDTIVPNICIIKQQAVRHAREAVRTFQEVKE